MVAMHFSWCEVMQVAWQKGYEVQQLWRDVVALLAYPHVWIRKASGRLLGLLLSNTKLGQQHAATACPSLFFHASRQTCGIQSCLHL